MNGVGHPPVAWKGAGCLHTVCNCPAEQHFSMFLACFSPQGISLGGAISSPSSLKATFPSLPFFFICEVLFQCLSSHLFLLLFFFSFLLLRSQYFITERELNVILTLHRKMLFVRSARWVPNTQKQESRQTWLPPSSVGPYRGTIKQCWFILIPHLAFVLPQGIQPLFERLNLFIPI